MFPCRRITGHISADCVREAFLGTNISAVEYQAVSSKYIPDNEILSNRKDITVPVEISGPIAE